MIPLGVIAARRPVACKNLVITDGVWFSNGNYVAPTAITYENALDHHHVMVPVTPGATISISRQSRLANNDRFRMGFTKTDPQVAGTDVFGYVKKDGATNLNLDGVVVPAGCVWFVAYLGYGPHGTTIPEIQATRLQVEYGPTSTTYTDCSL